MIFFNATRKRMRNVLRRFPLKESWKEKISKNKASTLKKRRAGHRIKVRMSMNKASKRVSLLAELKMNIQKILCIFGGKGCHMAVIIGRGAPIKLMNRDNHWQESKLNESVVLNSYT